jgi:hypothetical protein
MYSFRQASSLHTLNISTNGLTSEGFNAFCNDVRMQNSLKALVIYGDRCTCTHTGTGTSTGTDTGTVVANGTSEMGICFNLIVRLKSLRELFVEHISQSELEILSLMPSLEKFWFLLRDIDNHEKFLSNKSWIVKDQINEQRSLNHLPKLELCIRYLGKFG